MRYAAFLRAVNVGGTGKLPMADLRRICNEIGLLDVKTYIASGNVALTHDGPASEVAESLEKALAHHAGKPVGVIVRTAAQLADILSQNPFAEVPGNRVLVTLLPAGTAATTDAKNQTTEEIVAAPSHIYVNYPEGIGQSRLILSASKLGTARNLNTIKAMSDLLAAP